MKKNLINPIVPRIEDEVKSPLEHFNDAIEAIVQNFKKDAMSGKLRAKSIEDVNRLIAIHTLLNSLGGNDSVQAQESLLSTLAEDDPVIQDLYMKIFETYNENNDKANEGR